MRATAIVRTNSNGSSSRGAVQRRAFDLHQAVDRHRIRMRRQVGQRLQQAGALRARLAHADDAAAAGLHAGVAHVRQRVEAVLELAGVDDLAVELRARCRGCGCSSRGRRPSARCACGPLSMPSVAQVSRPSAFTSRIIAATLGMSRSFGERQAAPMQKREAPAALACRGLLEHRFGAHQLRGLDPGVVARGLRAVGAVLRAAAGLHRQQRADLDLAPGRNARGAPAPARCSSSVNGSSNSASTSARVQSCARRGGRLAECTDGGHGSFLTAAPGRSRQSGNHVRPCQPKRGARG